MAAPSALGGSVISEHLSSWLGFPVQPLGFEEIKSKLPDLSKTVCRLYVEWESEGSFDDLVAQFLKLPGVERTPAVIIGAFAGDDPGAESTAAVNLLVNAKPRLTSLRGIFLGDIIGEENEISWINQSDVSPLFSAYPELEHFAVRGGTGLVLGSISHPRLKSLVIQSGGLPRSVLIDLASAQLPALEHLELWLGSDNYGWDGTVADLQPLLETGRFPKLRHLALCNSEVQDDVAAHVAFSPILDQLESLDLSMGNLSDDGAEALLRNPALRKLKTLDLSHHFLTPPVMARIKAAFPQADLSDPQEADVDGDEVYRHIAVSE